MFKGKKVNKKLEIFWPSSIPMPCANHDMFKGMQGNKELAQMFDKANDMEKISYSSI